MSLRTSLAALTLGLTLGASASQALAATGTPAPGPATDFLSERWHYTEVVLFQRTTVTETGTAERLQVDAHRVWPGNLRSLAPAGEDSRAQCPTDQPYPMCFSSRVDPAAGIPPMQLRAAAPGPGATSVVTAMSRPASAGMAAAPDSSEPRPGAPQPDDPAGGPADSQSSEAQFAQLVRDFELGLREQSLHWLPARSHTLAQEVARLERRGGYEVLFHQRWIEVLPPRRAPRPILIQAGATPGGAARLEGWLQVTSGRYLHFDAELWYQDDADDAGTDRYMVLRESRRMRNGELHYLDHPKLGILVRTGPMEPPAELINALAALGEPVE
jgi:hypothetical protein